MGCALVRVCGSSADSGPGPRYVWHRRLGARQRRGQRRLPHHLHPDYVDYVARDTGATVEVEFTDNKPAHPRKTGGRSRVVSGI